MGSTMGLGSSLDDIRGLQILQEHTPRLHKKENKSSPMVDVQLSSKSLFGNTKMNLLEPS